MKILKQATRRGYKGVTLFGPKKIFYVQVLVLMAFRGPRPKGHQASHLNGKSADNALANLRWETASKNLSRRYAHGTVLLGERANNSTLKTRDVRNIRRWLADGMSRVEIARLVGCSRSNVRWIEIGRTWGHVK